MRAEVNDDPDALGVVALSYDGADICHLETVLPQLDRYGIVGTFYADPVCLLQQPREWARASERGHEIGNGCLLAAALPDGSLPAWTPEMIAEDVRAADQLIREVVPAQDECSIAYPLGVPRCAQGHDYRATVERLSRVARSGIVGFNRLESTELRYLRCLPTYDMSGDELISYARAARDQRVLAVFVFAGVGVGELSVDSSAHEDLCAWLSREHNCLELTTVAGLAAQATAPRRTAFRLA